MSDHNIRVIFNPPHDDAAHINEAGDPILTWEGYPNLGNGWLLSWGDGEDWFVGGDLTDVDWAVEQANRWLDMVAEHEDE